MSRVIAVRHGPKRAVVLAGIRGPKGPVIAGVEVDADGYLVVTLDDGTTVISAAPVNRPWGTIIGDISDQADLMELLGDLEDSIPTAPADIGAATAAQGELADTAVQPDDIADVVRDAELESGLAGKVDKVAGKQLSTEDFTSALKDKLTGLEGTHWRGTFVSEAALAAGVPAPAAGDYADVDGGAEEDVARYIWDVSDEAWVRQSGVVPPLTAAQVKLLYESNADTNAFTDAEKSALAGKLDATATAADSSKLNGQPASYYATAAQVGDFNTFLDIINGEVI